MKHLTSLIAVVALFGVGCAEDDDTASGPTESSIRETDAGAPGTPDPPPKETTEPEPEYDAVCMVFFKDRAGAFDAVYKNFEENYSYTGPKRIDDSHATLDGPSEPRCRYELEYRSGPVAVDATETFGPGTDHEAAIKKCDAMIIVRIENLDAALDEANTLMEIEWAAAEAVDGYAYLSWNGNVVTANDADSNSDEADELALKRAFELAGYFAAHGMWTVSDGDALSPVLAYIKGCLLYTSPSPRD